jgi:hypothetical protein
LTKASRRGAKRVRQKQMARDAVAYWAKALSVETDKVVQSNRDKLMKQELERYMAHAIGAKPRDLRPNESPLK